MAIRKIISGADEPPVKELMGLNILSLISQILQMQDVSEEVVSIKYEALWILTNLAYGDEEDVIHILDVRYEIPESLSELLKRNDIAY
jgi:hypothetical protein